MRKFTPAEGFNRVSFAARGQDAFVVVPDSGLLVEETEPRTVSVIDADSGEPREEQIEVPINGDLIAVLSEHPHVQEVPVGVKVKHDAQDPQDPQDPPTPAE